MKIITATELKALLDAKAELTLLHVLPEDHFACGHLPGALNACVYEMVFVDRVKEWVPDTTRRIVVYGQGGSSLDSAVAAEKLAKAGYTQVEDLREGLAGWQQASFPLEGDGAKQTKAEVSGVFAVDVNSSVVRWTGRNLFNHHHGTVKLQGGQITIQQGRLQSAHFTLDMNSIACEDLTDSAYNALLIRHLRDEDFFAVDRFPTAEFQVDGAEGLPSCTAGTPNYELVGTLTLRGVTQPLRFPAVIAAADEDHLTGQAQFEIDRTQFGSQYGSGRLFAFLGKHVVNDHIHLHVKLQATRQG